MFFAIFMLWILDTLSIEIFRHERKGLFIRILYLVEIQTFHYDSGPGKLGIRKLTILVTRNSWQVTWRGHLEPFKGQVYCCFRNDKFRLHSNTWFSTNMAVDDVKTTLARSLKVSSSYLGRTLNFEIFLITHESSNAWTSGNQFWDASLSTFENCKQCR